MTAALAVAILVSGGVYLVLQRGLVRVTLGFILLGHAANVLLLAAGGMARREAPLVGRSALDHTGDPLPQAFALTAIVITFGITVYLFGLAGAGADAEPDGRNGADAADDDHPDDVPAAAEPDAGRVP